MLEYWGSENAPEGFKDAWLDYCYYYSATAAEQKARYSQNFTGISLVQTHSCLTAYFAARGDNATVAQCAWNEFLDSDKLAPNETWSTERVGGSDVLIPINEAAWLSTMLRSMGWLPFRIWRWLGIAWRSTCRDRALSEKTWKRIVLNLKYCLRK